MNTQTKTSSKLLASLSLLALLSGCANFKDIYSNAGMRQADDIASNATLPGEGGQWPDTGWAQIIGGTQLQALVDEALANSPNLRVAEARVNAARAAADAAHAATGASINANFSSTYQRYTENGIIPPPLAGEYLTDNLLALNFAYDFDFWGRHKAALRAALAQGQVAQAEQYAARLMLSTAIARSWVQLTRQQGQYELVQQQLTARRKIDELTRLRYRSGLDSESDNEEAQQQIASLRAEQTQWQEAIGLTRNQLAALMGQGPDRGLSIVPGHLPDNTAQQDALPDALPAGLLGRRPDIVAARWRVEAAQHTIDENKAQFYPDVNLMAFAGFSSIGLSDLLQAGSRVVGAGPAVHLPIFGGGALRAQLKGSVAAYDVAVGSYNQALTEALHDVADQVQSLRRVREQGEHVRVAANAAAKSIQLARERERVGTANMLPVFAAEMGLLAQRRAVLDIAARQTDLRVGLIKALGGGYNAAPPSSTVTGNSIPAGAAAVEQTLNTKSTS